MTKARLRPDILKQEHLSIQFRTWCERNTETIFYIINVDHDGYLNTEPPTEFPLSQHEIIEFQG